MRRHDEHAANHGTIHQRLNDDGFFGFPLLRRIPQQVADPLHHGEQRRRASIGRRHKKAQYDIDKEHAPDDAAHAGCAKTRQNSQRNAPIQADQLHDRPDQEGKKTQPDDVIGKPGKNNCHGRFPALPGYGPRHEQERRDGNPRNTHGHGVADPHDAGPQHYSQHGHTVMRQAGEGLQHGPEQNEKKPCEKKSRKDATGVFPRFTDIFTKIVSETEFRNLRCHAHLLFIPHSH